jgi:hypothetical protein
MHITPLLERPLDIDQPVKPETEPQGETLVMVDDHMVVIEPETTSTPKGGARDIGAGGIVQLRPCFEHLDKSAKEADELRRKAKLDQYIQKKKEEDAGGAVHNGDGSVSVQFKKRESAYSKQAKKHSHASMIEREGEEAWIECEYFPAQVCRGFSACDPTTTTTTTTTATATAKHLYCGCLASKHSLDICLCRHR